MASSTQRTKKNWPIVVAAGALIAVPLGLAVKHDLEGKRSQASGRGFDVDHPPEAVIKAPEEVPVPAPAPVGAWEQPAMDRAFFDDVFGAAERAPGGKLADPAWWDAPASDPRWPGVTIEPIREANGRVTAVAISFRDDGSAARLFEASWGPAAPMSDFGRGASRVWSNPQRGLDLALFEGASRARVIVNRPADQPLDTR